jgi:hypothetical protein
MSNRIAFAVTAGILLPAISGCVPGPTSGKGFTLPEGSTEQGQAAFVSLKCHACHSISGVELPEITAEIDPKVQLGGKVPRISTYGELVTSIINPSHKLARGHSEEEIAKDGQSKMKNYNDVLTVQQLTDLVAFLQSRYELEPLEPTYYPPLY